MALVPVPGLQPIVDARYCVQQPTVLILKEKFFSFTGDSATIKDQSGVVWFKVNPKMFSLREKRVVEDAYGQPAFSLKTKTLTLHNTWEMYRGESYDKKNKICDIKQGLLAASSPDIAKLMGSTVKVFCNDGDKEADYYAEGNFRAKKFKIFKVVPGGGKGNDIMIAQIEKESRFSSVTNFIMSSQDANGYFLQLQPGADAAFATALAIVIDEYFRDGSD